MTETTETPLGEFLYELMLEKHEKDYQDWLKEHETLIERICYSLKNYATTGKISGQVYEDLTERDVSGLEIWAKRNKLGFDFDKMSNYTVYDPTGFSNIYRYKIKFNWYK